jgi:hypothetical protein
MSKVQLSGWHPIIVPALRTVLLGTTSTLGTAVSYCILLHCAVVPVLYCMYSTASFNHTTLLYM